MLVELQQGEMAIAQVLAALRNASNRSSNITNAKVGRQSDYQTDLDGIVAELAFAKAMNCCPDFSITPRSGGADAVVKGKRIDVKATRYDKGRLLAVASKESADSDIYVLAIVNENVVQFRGWAYSDELLRNDNLTNLGHGKTYALPQHCLRPFRK